jgi:hypothetical protein
MRFTQFGHQVPRKNSKINEPAAFRLLRRNWPSPFAAPKANSGARLPISSVSVRVFTWSDSKPDEKLEQRWKGTENHESNAIECPSLASDIILVFKSI